MKRSDNSEPFLDFRVLDMIGEKEFTMYMHWPTWGNPHHYKKLPEGTTSFKIVDLDELITAGVYPPGCSDLNKDPKYKPWVGFSWLVIWRGCTEPNNFCIYKGITEEFKTWWEYDEEVDDALSVSNVEEQQNGRSQTTTNEREDSRSPNRTR